MRTAPHRAEKHRVTLGPLASSPLNGNNGKFKIRCPMTRRTLTVIASDGLDWDHVSVSLPDRCPTWEEMDFVKRIFWSDTEAVYQLHPPRTLWVNNHPYCLHLWKPQAVIIPLPHPSMVGILNGRRVQAELDSED